ncbi:hypothetical protein chiPu_0011440 [Chiloscyllium punctatum]|uniref:Uncharacterized protein n=1 Tax=Chiloscyllium punctatum TaxID=137246 RepID=A0A401SRH6_CHIPU|nr:hypothetical protein [Chiloscyllium punctatum]
MDGLSIYSLPVTVYGDDPPKRAETNLETVIRDGLWKVVRQTQQRTAGAFLTGIPSPAGRYAAENGAGLAQDMTGQRGRRVAGVTVCAPAVAGGKGHGKKA